MNDKDKETEEKVKEALKREAMKVKPKGTLKDIQDKIKNKDKK